MFERELSRERERELIREREREHERRIARPAKRREAGLLRDAMPVISIVVGVVVVIALGLPLSP